MISNQPISILTEGRHVTKQRHENKKIQINNHPAKNESNAPVSSMFYTNNKTMMKQPDKIHGDFVALYFSKSI